MSSLAARAGASAVRYEGRVTVALAAIVLSAGVGFVGLQSAMAPPARIAARVDSSPSFAVRDPELIRPDSATYARFADDDANWRRMYASPPVVRAVSDGAVADAAPWRPSARQVLDDRVFTLARAGRVDRAIAVLAAWVDRHPTDRVELLKLARLHNQAGQGDASIARYRQLLALDRRRGR